MPNPIETVFYIHGVSNDRRRYLHTGEYHALNSGIGQFAPGWPTNFGGAEWGWHYKKIGAPKSHELLTDAQRLLGSRAIAALKDPWDFTANPARLIINGIRESGYPLRASYPYVLWSSDLALPTSSLANHASNS